MVSSTCQHGSCKVRGLEVTFKAVELAHCATYLASEQVAACSDKSDKVLTSAYCQNLAPWCDLNTTAQPLSTKVGGGARHVSCLMATSTTVWR